MNKERQLQPQCSAAEFSRPIAVYDIVGERVSFRIEASVEERAALAERFGLLRLDGLSAEGWVIREAGGQRFRLRGRFSAAVVQSCVVTLEPVSSTVEQSFEELFAADVVDEWGDPSKAHCEVILSQDSEPAPVPLVDGQIDVGELVAEELALGLNSFPRAPGATFAGYDPQSADIGEQGQRSPFAVLMVRNQGPHRES